MKVVPAGPERWADIEALFGEKGGYAGCWIYAGYMGIASVYKKLGFKQVGRASETQLIMRLML